MSADPTSMRGPIAWMARNAVAANLLMLLLIVGGLLFAQQVRQEVFPEIDLDIITVSVSYPGASPEEVEEGVVLAVEEAVRGVDGIKEVSSVVNEGRGVVLAELLLDTDADQALNDVKSAVDRITSFPEDAERPVISLATNREQVLNLIVYGDLELRELDGLAEQLRGELLDDPRITLIEVDGLPPPEVSIEVPQEQLRRYGLTLPEIARRVRAASIDLPGGTVKTAGGDVLVRTTERREFGDEFEDIAVISNPDGSRVTLGEMATIVDGYRDTDTEAFYDGHPAVRLKVFRVGDESPLTVADAVHEFIDTRQGDLPETVNLVVTDDSSEAFRDRIGLLIDNGRLGALLVLIVLGIFLQPRLAFWVTLGMPISFLGVFLFMPMADISINIISLFAFILTLGIVVDDAVVVGEAVFANRSRYNDPLTSAVAGTREVLTPVVFAVLTTVLAFMPLLFVPGIIGKFFINIPMIVIPILLLSLVECLLILPAHLAHVRRSGQFRPNPVMRPIYRWQKQFSNGLENWIENRFRPMAERVAERRYLALSAALSVLIVAWAMLASGRVPLTFFPRVEADFVSAGVELPFGAPVHETHGVMERMIAAAREVEEELGGEDVVTGDEPLVTGIYSEIGKSQPNTGGGDISIGTQTGGHRALVTVYLAPAGDREVSAEEFANRWRREVGEPPAAERMTYNYSVGPAAGAKVAIQLSHRDVLTLEHAAARLAGELSDYAGVFDVDSGLEQGKPQLDLELKPAARSLGITESDLANQIRAAFFGAESLRQQRGRDELRVYVRLPESERETLYSVETFIVRTPGGGEIPLGQAARVTEGRSFTEIRREDGKRVIEVSSDVDENVANAGQITAALTGEVLPLMQQELPGLTWSLSGEQEAQAESIGGLMRGMVLALLAMYALMAVAFRSYVQPLLVLFAVPFGLIGAVLGHAIMGYTMSFVSVLGLVALSGVVINGSLVLITAINDFRKEGVELQDAVISGTVRRVRPVVLTSLTTFFGLTPIIFETSLQARFLIPMAISLGFGVLFVTAIALLLVPASYLAMTDVQRWVAGRRAARLPQHSA
ncbi:efflux RND transporter permease subunit [Lentisalinibacter sediminis]|uniref:efflux RND transporter permease subunit n=1 Tax=Lentisalinibacter sediminis TaxID=2992237 RepID=UPI0038704A1C